MTFTTRLKEELTTSSIIPVESLIELSAFVRLTGQIKKKSD